MDEDRFLERWSRLKRETGAPEPPAATEAPPQPEPQPEPEPEITPEEIAALPDVASVTMPGDLAVFLRRGVPAALRHAALRRMWVLNPAIRDYVDDAREYAMDWNAPGGVPGGGIVTQEEARALVERFFAARPAAEAAPQPPGTAAPADDGTDTKLLQDIEVSHAQPAPEAARDAPEEPQMPPARRRHGGATPS